MRTLEIDCIDLLFLPKPLFNSKPGYVIATIVESYSRIVY